MSCLQQHNNNVKLLAALVDPDDKDESEYRFLIDGKNVKYITVEPGTLPRNDRTFAPVLIPLLPPFPNGDWNQGHIAKDSKTGRPAFVKMSKYKFPGIQNTWHDTYIDHLEFEEPERLRQTVHVVKHPMFSSPVLFKFAQFPWQLPFFEAETTAYQGIDGKEIGPKFLGHVTEEGRVFGFVVEYIAGSRTAVPDDLTACRNTLGKLHALGIKHGDINKFNFLVQDGGDSAVLIDFETAEKCADKAELKVECRRLEESLSDLSYRGGVGPKEYGSG